MSPESKSVINHTSGIGVYGLFDSCESEYIYCDAQAPKISTYFTSSKIDNLFFEGGNLIGFLVV